MLKHFLSYYWRAKTLRSVKNPFIRQLISEVVEDDRYYYIFDDLAFLKAKLLQQTQSIDVLDLGAGSRKKQGKQRRICDIAKQAVSPDWQGKLLYRLLKHLPAENRLEIGTSLGITTMYQYFAHPKGSFISLEGSPEIARLARQHFEQLGASRIQLMEGNFDETLEQALKKLGRLDYAFIDGNHRKEATLAYFEACLPYLHEGSYLVFDDIYWSNGMAQAWKNIRQHPKVRLSIDLFWCGIVFFQPQEKQEIALISRKYKPV